MLYHSSADLEDLIKVLQIPHKAYNRYNRLYHR